MEACCLNCTHFTPYEDKPQEGVCFRYPPQLLLVNYGKDLASYNPPVSGESRCGEYKIKASELAPKVTDEGEIIH